MLREKTALSRWVGKIRSASLRQRQLDRLDLDAVHRRAYHRQEKSAPKLWNPLSRVAGRFEPILRTPNGIGLEFALRQFPDFEVVIATHVDTGHLHNHFVVNSVSCMDGHKLHQSPNNLLTHRQVNDEICLAHGLRVLDECELRTKKKRMKPSEYQAGLRGDSWKLDLIQAINEALECADDRESFIRTWK